METVAEPNGTVLRVSGLMVGYGARPILDDVSLDLRSGEIVTLLGRNGCGKSTFLKSIAGLVPSSGGNVVLNSIDITKDSPHQRASHGVGFLMQGQAVFPSLSVKENLSVAGRKGGTNCQRQSLSTVWQSFPILLSLAKRRAGLLSGGERQMLALAMVFIRGAKLWLLDEPSAGLDTNGAIRIMRLIKDINQLHGITVLVVEQNASLAVGIANRVCFIRKRSMVTVAAEDAKESDWLRGIYNEER